MPTEKCSGPYGSDREVSWPDRSDEVTSSCKDEKLFKEVEQMLEDFEEINLRCESDRRVLTYVITKFFKRKGTKSEDL